MIIRNISSEASGLEDPELIDFILTDVKKRRRRYGKLLLAGFDGQEVVPARSFGSRWRTYALTPEEAMQAEINCGEDSIIEFAVEVGEKPTIGVFNGDILKAVADDTELCARYLRESGDDLLMGRLYGVPGPSLDVAALAVYHFALGFKRV